MTQQSMRYTVTVTDWTKPRGYANSGRGWRVRCFGLLDGDMNGVGRTVYEQYFRTEAKARAEASKVAQTWGAEILT